MTDILLHILPFAIFLIPELFKTKQEDGENRTTFQPPFYVLIFLFAILQFLAYWQVKESSIQSKREKLEASERWKEDSIRMVQIINQQNIALNQLTVIDSAAFLINETVNSISAYNKRLSNENISLRKEIDKLNKVTRLGKHPISGTMKVDFDIVIDISHDTKFVEKTYANKLNNSEQHISEYLLENYKEVIVTINFETLDYNGIVNEIMKKYSRSKNYENKFPSVAVSYQSKNILDEYIPISYLASKIPIKAAIMTMSKSQIYIKFHDVQVELRNNDAALSSLLELCPANMRIWINANKSKNNYLRIKCVSNYINVVSESGIKLRCGKNENIDGINRNMMYFELEENCWSGRW